MAHQSLELNDKLSFDLPEGDRLLEVEIELGRYDGYTGTLLTKAQALQLRDWLNSLEWPE